MDIEKKREEKMNLTKVGYENRAGFLKLELHRKDFGKVFEACSHSLGNTCIAEDFDVTKVLPTQVPPRGGSCIWGPTG
ncbi:hypothetical protein V1477_000512 [Vespula maculifrons]|uniref:Uncharacterized protein n=1 Tax=Vespula maculifrons TaxID=7453 RepID=A0ABD2D337_VESMC